MINSTSTSTIDYKTSTKALAFTSVTTSSQISKTMPTYNFFWELKMQAKLSNVKSYLILSNRTFYLLFYGKYIFSCTCSSNSNSITNIKV